MARKTIRKPSPVSEEIDVSRFKDIQIQFPGDVYLLAVWLAMSDRSRSTPTMTARTTLHGLARSLGFLNGFCYSKALTTEDVMAVFRQHGISGNPWLRLEPSADENLALRLVENTPGRLPARSAGSAEHGERAAPRITGAAES